MGVEGVCLVIVEDGVGFKAAEPDTAFIIAISGNDEAVGLEFPGHECCDLWFGQCWSYSGYMMNKEKRLAL